MGQVAVLFGGPAPEHDVSILTGLQAARELAAAGRDVVAIYWTKAGAFVSWIRRLEAAAFVEGAAEPRRAAHARARARRRVRAVGTARPRRGASSSTPSCSAPTAAPARTARCRGRSTSRASATRARPLQGAALGMDKLAFSAVMAAAGVAGAAAGRARPRRRATVPFERPVHRQAPLRRLVDRDRRGRRPRDGACAALARTRTSPRARSSSRSASDLRGPPGRRADAPGARALRDRAAAATRRAARRSSTTPTSTSPARGWPPPPRELPAVLDDADRRARPARRRRRSRRRCLVRGIARIDFLEGDDELYVNEINTIPGSLSRHLFIDPPRHVPRAARRPRGRGADASRRTAT